MGGLRPPLPILRQRYSSLDWSTEVLRTFPWSSCHSGEFSFIIRVNPMLALPCYLSLAFLLLELLGATIFPSLRCYLGGLSSLLEPLSDILESPLLPGSLCLPWCFGLAFQYPCPVFESWRPLFQDSLYPFLISSFFVGGAPSYLTTTFRGL